MPPTLLDEANQIVRLVVFLMGLYLVFRMLYSLFGLVFGHVIMMSWSCDTIAGFGLDGVFCRGFPMINVTFCFQFLIFGLKRALLLYNFLPHSLHGGLFILRYSSSTRGFLFLFFISLIYKCIVWSGLNKFQWNLCWKWMNFTHTHRNEMNDMIMFYLFAFYPAFPHCTALPLILPIFVVYVLLDL